jgi:purine-binding chemotaxis protein CheW
MQSLDSATPSSDAPVPAAALMRTREFLAFNLGAEEFGIDILKVQEIRCYEKPTRMAGVPDFIKGVVNLRGVIVPIVDLRIKFSLPEVEYNDFTVVIVLNLHGRIVGIVVDGVSDVTSLQADQIKPAPEFSSHLDTSHVIGLGTLEERMLILMDIERLMSSPDMSLANRSVGAEAHA